MEKTKTKEKKIRFVRISFLVNTQQQRKDFLEVLKSYPSKIKFVEIVK